MPDDRVQGSVQDNSVQDSSVQNNNRQHNGRQQPAPNLLHEEYTIDTPENVTFGYSIAGIGSRFIGALIDTSLLALALLLLNIAVSLALASLGSNAPAVPLDAEPSPDWVAGLLIALYALLNFGLIWGYYLLFELLWNGQTPGKRLARTQVVQANGAPAGFTDIAIRNLVRIVDFLPVAYGVGLVVMFSNRRARRLGDFAANTLVIRRREQVRLADLGYSPTAPAADTPAGVAAGTTTDAATSAAAALVARFPHLERLTDDDYQLMREVLARRAQGAVDTPLLRRVAVAMAARSGVAPPPPDLLSTRQFLEELLAAQRAMHS
jgi:uncharacterized RDD family membrane protein YckC